MHINEGQCAHGACAHGCDLSNDPSAGRQMANARFDDSDLILVLLSVSFGIYGPEGRISPRVTEYVQIYGKLTN